MVGLSVLVYLVACCPASDFSVLIRKCEQALVCDVFATLAQFGV